MPDGSAVQVAGLATKGDNMSEEREELSLALKVVIDTMEDLAVLTKRVADRDTETLNDLSALVRKLRDKVRVDKETT